MNPEVVQLSIGLGVGLVVAILLGYYFYRKHRPYRPTNAWFLARGYTHEYNIYGDMMINKTDARSVWTPPDRSPSVYGCEIYYGKGMGYPKDSA